jgi:hypothetical protein
MLILLMYFCAADAVIRHDLPLGKILPRQRGRRVWVGTSHPGARNAQIWTDKSPAARECDWLSRERRTDEE